MYSTSLRVSNKDFISQAFYCNLQSTLQKLVAYDEAISHLIFVTKHSSIQKKNNIYYSLLFLDLSRETFSKGRCKVNLPSSKSQHDLFIAEIPCEVNIQNAGL